MLRGYKSQESAVVYRLKTAIPPPLKSLFKKHNLAFLTNAMLMFADKHGDSVIIEGDEFLRIEGDHQVVTKLSAPQVSNLISEKQNQERLLVFVRLPDAFNGQHGRHESLGITKGDPVSR